MNRAGSQVVLTEFRASESQNISIRSLQRQFDTQWRLFPNPAIDKFQIDLSKLPQDNYYLRLIDHRGHIIRNQQVLSMTNDEFDTADLSSGLYLVQLRNSKGGIIGIKRLQVIH